ncbi:MAG: hypothetical protein HOH74_04435 [Gemmatimonadetes bacterium]|nr:hypothetical protein [Gemmatimonadota bacterium]
MRVGLLGGVPGLSEYSGEILSMWGVLNVSRLTPGQLQGLDPAQIPVLVLPAGADVERAVVGAILDYARRGGAVISCLPGLELAGEAGICIEGDREGPQRLRLTSTPMAGLAGESLVVVGPSQTWSLPDNEPVTVTLESEAKPPPPTDAVSWAVLYPAGQDAGGEAPGVVQRNVGAGTIMALAFDLPLAVLMLRQGDPNHTESGGRPDGPARPAHLACEVGPQEPDSIPYADLLGRLLAEWVTDLFPCPLPHLWHLPDGAPGIVVYSGDEDGADVEWNQQQFAEMTEAGGRMNLYVIPDNTHSTPSDVSAYRQHHDVGPHPNIRSHDGAPVAARVEEMVRQIQQFEEMFGIPARSLRNHCIAWAGYLEPVRAMADIGVGMEGNYFCSTFLRDRGYAPYAAFGAAMPLRFGHPDGELLSVRQQHTHTMDDVYFGPQYVPYSYAMAPDLWEIVLARVLDDVVQRFHVPHATCIHPSNWVRFSRDQGLALVRQAVERQLPVWSFDQWLGFLETRETWHCESIRWETDQLHAAFTGGLGPFCFVMPRQWQGKQLVALEVEGGDVAGTAQRYGHSVEMIRVETGPRLQLVATYGDGQAPSSSR